MSVFNHKRQHSDASLPSADSSGDSWGTGSLRLRKDKVRCKMAAIPKMEFGGVSPLKQLQRMKEDDTLATLPRSAPNISLHPENTAHNGNEVQDTSASDGGGLHGNGNAGEKESKDHLGMTRSDTNGNMRVVGDSRVEVDGGDPGGEDVNANHYVISGVTVDSSSTDTPDISEPTVQVPQGGGLIPPETTKRKPPDVSPRHSSLIKTNTIPGMTDFCPTATSTPVHMPAIPDIQWSPTKRSREPPPLLPKPKPKIIVKLVRDDPELRASQEKLTRTASDASGRVAAVKAVDRRAPPSEASSDVANTEDINDSLRDLHIPGRNSGLYSSFKDVRGSSNSSLNVRSSNTSPSSSVRDVNSRPTSKVPEDAYIRVEPPNSKYTHVPLQETVVMRRERPASVVAKDKRLSKSAEELDKAALALLDLTGPYLTPRSRLRSSLTEGKDDIYHSIGDVQTLLKCNLSEEERIYSLPQPQCYGDNTLKAVKEITEKYDTLQRRKLRALSFRENGRYEKNSLPSDTSHPICGDLAVPSEEVFGAITKPDAPKKYGSGVTARDVTRLDLFYRSYGTEVYVCRCLCDLSFTTPPPNSEELTNWEPVKSTGIPVLILNTGDGKRRRELFITIAERETGFSLWKDKINYLSNYREYKPGVHVMQMSNNLRRVAGFRFYSRDIAKDFMADFRNLTSDPNDDIWKISNPKKQPPKKRWGLRRSKSKKGPKKTDISQPCHFVHVTYVDANDAKDCMQDIPTGSDSPIFRQRLSTTWCLLL